MLVFILSNVIVASSSFLWTRAFYSKKSFVDFVLIWFIFFFAEIILIELFLGILGKLFLTNLIILQLVILLIAAYFFKRNIPYPSFYRIHTDGFLKDKVLIFAVSVFLGFFLVKLWINLLNPPYGADSLIYHLTYPATWIKRGDLYQPIVVFGNIVSNSTPYFPINAELFFFWLMLPFRSAFLADMGVVPFYFLGILAIYSILRKMGIGTTTALLIGLLWALIPNVFKQIEQGSYVDVICAALFLLCLNFILSIKEECNFKNAVLLGIATGLFLGVKRLNIFWTLGLVPLFLYIFIKAVPKKSIKAGVMFIVLACILLLGSYSYIRAYLLTGNFLYPVNVSFLGKTIIPGYLDIHTTGDLYYPWRDFNLRKFIFSEGLGLQFFAFVFPGTILSLALLPFLRNKVKPFIESTLIFIIPAFMLFVFLFYIKAYWVRYLFPYLAVGFIAAAIWLNQFKGGRKYITVMGFICILSSTGEFCGYGQLVASYFLSVVVLFLFYIWRRASNKMEKSFKIGIVVLSMFLSLFGLWILNNKYNREEFARYKYFFVGKESEDRDLAVGWEWMNGKSSTGSRVAYAGRSTYYPLFGSRLKNDVFYVSVNDKPSLPNYYSDGLFRKEKDFNSWKENLSKRATDSLFIMSVLPVNNDSGNPEEFPIEDKWASENPEIFKLVYNNKKVRIYSLIPKGDIN